MFQLSVIQLISIQMIQKCLRFSSPLYIFNPFYSLASAVKKAPNVVKVAPSMAQEEKMVCYHYRKSAINDQLSICFKEFQVLTIKKGEQSVKITEIFLQALENMDIDTLTSQNMKQVIQLLAKLKDEKNAALTIKQKLEERLSHFKNEAYENDMTIGLLIRLYANHQHINGNETDMNLAQEIIKCLKSGQTDSLKMEQIVSYFVYLNSLHQPSTIQRQIRSVLMNIVKDKLETLSLADLASFGVEINRISHHDFSDQQLQIAQQVFTKMEKKRKQFDEKAIERIFNTEQCLSNKASLQEFHRNAIKDFLHLIKKNNTAEAQKLFALIMISHQKFKRNDNEDIVVLPQEIFILKYTLLNGRTKKHNNSINIALEELIPHYFTQQSIRLLPQILIKANFKSSARLIYELKNKGIQIDELVQLVDMSNLTLEQTVLMLLALSHSQKWSKLRSKFKQTITPYFKSSQQFFILFKTLQKIKATSCLQNFYLMFVNQSKFLFNHSRQTLNQQEQLIFLKYFWLSLNYYEKNVNIFERYLKQLSRQIIDDLIEEQLKIKDNKNIGKIGFLLRVFNKNQASKSYVKALSRLLQHVQRKDLKKEEHRQFWRIMAINAIAQLLFKQKKIKLEYCQFLETLFSGYNSHYFEYYYTGQFFSVVQNLMIRINSYIEFPRVQAHIIKACLYYKEIDDKLVGNIKNIHQNWLSRQEIQKVKYIKSNKYVAEIQKINEKTLPILLFYHRKDNNLMITRENECLQVIRRSNVQDLYNYIVNMGCMVNRTNQKLYRVIMEEFTNKVDFPKVTLFPILRNIINIMLYTKDICHKFMSNYLKYLNSRPIDLQDYHVHVLILNLIGSLDLSPDLTSIYIKSLLQAVKQERLKIRKFIYYNVVNTNYLFDDAQLDIFLTLHPHNKHPYFFYLEQHFSPKLKEKIIDNILYTIFSHNNKDPRISKYLTSYQYIYLKKKYPQQTKHLDLSELTFPKAIFTYQWGSDFDKLIDAATSANLKVAELIFYDNRLFRIRNTVIVFLHRHKLNAIYQFAFYQRLLKVEYGEDIRVSIVFGFPSSYEHLQSNIKKDRIFTDSEWRIYFQDKSTKGKSYIQKSKTNGEDDQSNNKGNKGEKMFKIHERAPEKKKRGFMRSSGRS